MRIKLSRTQWEIIGEKTGWMKISKIVDMSKRNDVKKPMICDTCRRWATSNPDGSIEWKHYSYMTPEERSEVDNIGKLFNEGLVRFESTICSICLGEEDPTGLREIKEPLTANRKRK